MHHAKVAPWYTDRREHQPPERFRLRPDRVAHVTDEERSGSREGDEPIGEEREVGEGLLQARIGLAIEIGAAYQRVIFQSLDGAAAEDLSLSAATCRQRVGPVRQANEVGLYANGPCGWIWVFVDAPPEDEGERLWHDAMTASDDLMSAFASKSPLNRACVFALHRAKERRRDEPEKSDERDDTPISSGGPADVGRICAPSCPTRSPRSECTQCQRRKRDRRIENRQQVP
jgi:hypothetical protein